MKVFGTDYDGVIINIEPQKAKAFGALVYKKWGIKEGEALEYWLANGGNSRKFIFQSIFKKNFGRNLADPEYKKIEKVYNQILKTRFYPTVKLLPGALELLQYVRSHFDYTFVSSGIPEGEIQYLVNLNKLGDYFDSVFGTSKEYPTKREHFKKIIEEQEPKTIVWVADSQEDMRIGRQFGAVCIGVLTNHSKTELLNSGAKHAVKLNEVINIIKKEKL